MSPHPRFLEPSTLDEAVEALTAQGDGARLIAGGTAVVLLLRHKLIAPDALISLGRVPDLDAIREDEGGVAIGAMATLRDVERSPLVRARFPALAQACGEVGNVRVRNQATLGGNLTEADYASDPPAVLLALGASATAVGLSGARTLPLADFTLGFYTTALVPGEVLSRVFIPDPPPGARMTYLKFKSRSSEDRPCVGVAVVAAFEGQTCTHLRVVVGAACEKPERLPEVEAAAAGAPLTDARIEALAEGYAEALDPLDDLRGSAWYRREMIRVHVRRALLEVRDGRR